MNDLIRIGTIMAATFALSACGIFGGDDDEQKPMELTDIETTVSVKRLWNAKVGGAAEFLRIALRPVGDGTRIYAASRNGNVVALQPESGKEIWRTKLDIELSAGPGAGENLVVVGSSDGVLIALDAASGAEKWRSNISGESLARPLIRGEVVVAPTIDNRLHAVSAFDGSSRWTVDQPTPRLTMRGSASPVAVGTSVVAGFDNGKLLAIDACHSGEVDKESADFFQVTGVAANDTLNLREAPDPRLGDLVDLGALAPATRVSISWAKTESVSDPRRISN